MPNYDRTGPDGEGPLTGRQMGKCNPENGTKQKEKTENDSEDQAPHRFRGSFGDGQGRGLGRWRGRGRRIRRQTLPAAERSRRS